MVSSRYTRLMFRSTALFNLGAAALYLPGLGLAATLGLQPSAANSVFEQIALLAIIVFGAGYWMVSNNPGAHRGIVQLGLVGKLGLVAIAWAHVFLVGDANLRFAALASGDLLYALLFIHHLRQST